MSSSFTAGFPGALDPRNSKQPRPAQTYATANSTNNNNQPITPADSHLLSPYSSAHALSNSTSPDALSYTPDSSLSTGPAPDYTLDYSDDQFHGASFGDIGPGNTPSFLGDEFLNFDGADDTEPFPDISPEQAFGSIAYPISPDKTPLTTGTAVFGDQSQQPTTPMNQATAQNFGGQDHFAIQSTGSGVTAPELTPDTNDGASGDETQPPFTSLAMISPQVTVSEWQPSSRGPEAQFAVGSTHDSWAPRAPRSAAGDFAANIEAASLSGVSRNAVASEDSSSAGGRQGLAPAFRPTTEIAQSINQQASERALGEKNEGVAAWVSRSRSASIDPEVINNSQNARPLDIYNNVSEKEVPLGDQTVNRHVEGEMYINMKGNGTLDDNDQRIMRERMPWENGPRVQEIQSERTVPQTSAEAILRMKQGWGDNESIVSRAATWGTRRRSLPSIMDVEGVVSGNLLKKLSISSRGDGHVRRPSLISRIPSLVRKASTNQRKRRPSGMSEQPSEEAEPPGEVQRRESKDSLIPPSRTASWGINRKPVPSLNTAIFGMGAGAAAIASQHHARSDSLSTGTVTSPKSTFPSFNLFPPAVENKLRRPRSKTDISSVDHSETPRALVGLLKAEGGPPVAQLAKSRPDIAYDDDEDEEDEEEDSKLDIDVQEEIIPNRDGFRAHIIRLNPFLETQNRFLVERIAHLNEVRYKNMCEAKRKHHEKVELRRCANGQMCISLGGTARVLDTRAEPRGLDSSDGDSPLDNTLSNESFPAGIPVPPTPSLPAEFECQLCFSTKKFTKPSDWTKHVHEDVQPFTCTWERCKDLKMFKRKADWVRHENEGHRHLEWWTCDVEDCRHICYRRDNFLQHLVREHKFPEPKVKTKAQMKKNGQQDDTWSKVEQCHTETSARPSDEKCRFCEKSFPTWKKLTVHLAKHMENISLPVLKLVEAKEIDSNTIISPVQDPPPNNFGVIPSPMSATPIKQEPRGYDPSGFSSSPHHGPVSYNQHQSDFGMGMMATPTYSQPMNPSFYADMSPAPNPGMMYNQMSQAQYNHVPVANGLPFTGPMDNTYIGMDSSNLEAFPSFHTDSLGIQEPSIPNMGYSTAMNNPSIHNMAGQNLEQYSNQGSVSPYSRSPHQGHTNYYQQ